MTREAIDKDIDEQSLSSAVRSQRNSCLPIFRLPPEILENIFTQLARDHGHEANVCSTFRVPHWVGVSYICRHWRSVALNCPTLWSYHFTASLRWTEELLARSKQASLKIRIYFPSNIDTPWLSRLVEEVLNHAERIQELRLTIPETFFRTGLSLYLPRLQILDICTLGESTKQALAIQHGDALLLRTLKLTALSLPWHSTFNLSGVTTLSLRQIPYSSQHNIMEFLAILSRMQALTVLDSVCALPSARDFLSSRKIRVFQQVSLSSLSRLYVQAPLSTVVALLSCINIPLLRQLRLEIESESGSSVNDYTHFPSALAETFSQAKDWSASPELRSLEICFSSSSTLTLSASDRAYYAPNLPRPREDVSILLMIYVGMEESMAKIHGHRIMGEICCAIPSVHAWALHVIKPPSSLEFWRKTLGHFDGLRHIRLTNGCMPNLALLAELAGTPFEAATADHNSTPAHSFVPALEELGLYAIEFAPQHKSSGNVMSKNALLDALSTRKVRRRVFSSPVLNALLEEEDESDVEGGILFDLFQ